MSEDTLASAAWSMNTAWSHDADEVLGTHRQTFSDLEDAMDHGPWHVFHFVGHGGYDPGSDEGTIALASERGRTDAVGAEDLSRLLGDHYTLRQVVLNACDTGRSSPLDAFSSTAGALVRRGIPAVVAMQFAISDPAAICFAQTFYQNVAKLLPLDTSVMRARRALRRAKKDTLEWGTPVLYLRASDGRVFDTVPVSARLTFPDEAGERPPHTGSLSEQARTAEVEALYVQASSAFWTERWEQAVDLLQQVLTLRPDHQEAAGKLEHARRQMQLATRYAQASAAADAGEWDQAVTAYTAVADADPSYRDVSVRLETTRRQQQLFGLQAEARRLHQAREWAAVLKVSERMHALDPSAADPGGLVTEARAKLAQDRQAEQLAADYSTGLRLLEEGQWQQAAQTLEPISQHDPAYRDAVALLARARRELAASAPEPADPPRLAKQPTVVQTVRHGKAINAVAFSPDGRRLATGSSDKTARIWDAGTGQPGPSMKHEGWLVAVDSVAFSPDGSRLATAGGQVRIWDATSGQELLKLNENLGSSAVFSPDGSRLAIAGGRDTTWIVDATSGQELRSFGPRVQAVAFSPDGRRLATAHFDNTARIWDATSGQELLKLDEAGASVVFSPDGRWLATARHDAARIWDATSGQELHKLDDAGERAVFSPDGRWLATARFDAARIWDATIGRPLLKLKHDKPVQAVAFSPDGGWLATASGKTAQIWALEDGSHDG